MGTRVNVLTDSCPLVPVDSNFRPLAALRTPPPCRYREKKTLRTDKSCVRLLLGWAGASHPRPIHFLCTSGLIHTSFYFQFAPNSIGHENAVLIASIN